MKNTTRNDPCEFCDGSMVPRTIRARFSFKGNTIYVEGVPAWVCSLCGEHYFDAPVYKRLEAIASHRSRIRRTISFPLARYDKAIA